jgi:WS/DGAT/MGAT family acyltransferase
VPSAVSISVLLRVLQNLLKEEVPIRDMRSIAESIVNMHPRSQDPKALTTATRQALRRDELKRAGEAPRTLFNAHVSPHRVFEGRDFALDDIRTIRRAVPGSTVNDVVLAICGGAIRRYLLHRGALPESSLIATAPVNVRTDTEAGSGGNQVSAMFVAIRTDIPGALDRLVAVHEHTREAKELVNAYGARLMTDINKHIPAATLALAGRLATQLGLGSVMSPVCNCVITNVPGPQVPLYMNGARLVTQYGLGPVTDAIGLFITVLSYNGHITISFASCREMVPDPGYFADCFQESFDEMLAAASPDDPSTA